MMQDIVEDHRCCRLVVECLDVLTREGRIRGGVLLCQSYFGSVEINPVKPSAGYVYGEQVGQHPFATSQIQDGSGSGQYLRQEPDRIERMLQ